MTAMSMQPVLSAIAQRFYGDGEQEARLFEANGGRPNLMERHSPAME